MTSILLLLIFTGCQASPELIFERIEVVENAKYIKSDFVTGTLAGRSTLSANFTVLKELNYRITVSALDYRPDPF
jgi:hypothetical protein